MDFECEYGEGRTILSGECILLHLFRTFFLVIVQSPFSLDVRNSPLVINNLILKARKISISRFNKLPERVNKEKTDLVIYLLATWRG